jgi:hypothetical protein
MKKSAARIGVGLLFVAVVLLITPTTKSKPQGLAHLDGCTLKSLSGPYAFSFAGYFGSSNPYTPIAAAGTFTFQPDGTLTRAFNVSFGGSVFSSNDSGTYSVDPDCTFTANLPQAGEVWNLIPIENGRQLDFFINTTGRVGSGTLARQ